MPPSAANASGVAKRSMAAISADQTNTSSRLLSPECVATTAPIAPSTPGHDRRRSPAAAPRRAWRSTPAATASAASSSDGTGVRTSSGGSAMNQASAPSATPAQPSCLRRDARARDAAIVAPLTSAASSRLAARAQNTPRPRRSSPSTSTSALTTSTTRPWMIVVRFAASSGSKIVGIEVALRGAADQRAEQQRRGHACRSPCCGPSSATAMPRKPIWVISMSLVASAELPAEHVERARQPGEQRRRPPSPARSSWPRSCPP